MSNMIQIRNVPDRVHRELKARAALAGMSLSDYLLFQLRRSLERPTREELLKRVAKRAPVWLRSTPTTMVREERNRQ